ncbi:Arylsulfatase [Anaerohalosphaera lusitana]|uniref:Arylsulfatase n=1 Tax=Anaerohalosphaera lusitana TaxID=1936003 RepID=A0A1U9NN31_9BACT|nr:sulfatase [Anaerohalosphaera lusitana]AQT69321.1 Arylsulfatase [Anaerohalosphaera lusitana]
MMKRRDFIKYCNSAVFALPLMSLPCLAEEESFEKPTNFLLLTADDLNYDSVGCFGCEIPDITPNIDRLGADGVKFTNAHVNIAVCQPCRQSIMTGRYPHTNGAKGFEPINEDLPTLGEILSKAGYINGVLGKERHMRPKHKYAWDYYITEAELASGAGIGRSPEKYYNYAKKFFESSKKQGKPFFLNANSHDPHRPFAGSKQEERAWGHDLPKVTRWIKPEEVTVPGFLPDLPDVRKEIAQYFTSVHRCDQSIGAVLKALEETGLAENTLVMFLSDNGISAPFAKSNCYLTSTKTPWIVRWPGKVKPGTIDSQHMISGIDYMPTILEAAGIKDVTDMDGSSFMPLLHGVKQPERKYVFTEYHKTFAGRRYDMRAIQSKRFGYIFNPWAKRTGPMRMDSTSGLTFKAMKRAAKSNSKIADRVELFENRVLEEFYDFKNDPDGRNNLIEDISYQAEIRAMRELLEKRMKKTNDPALHAFQNRDNPKAIEKFMKSG